MKTECEILRPEDPNVFTGKCLHRDEASGAQVVCWNEPEEIWQANFFRRFVKPLSPDDTIVIVDYHV